MITIENGKLYIEVDNHNDLQKDIADIECWKSAILEMFNILSDNVDGGIVFWIGDLLKTLQYDTDFMKKQLSKPE